VNRRGGEVDEHASAGGSRALSVNEQNQVSFVLGRTDHLFRLPQEEAARPNNNLAIPSNYLYARRVGRDQRVVQF
jgi:hypothetical protein